MAFKTSNQRAGLVQEDPFEDYEAYVPSSPEGYLYYIKISFHSRVFYKLGFTKHSSLSDRFDKNKSNDADYISEVLFYQFNDKAYEIEQEIHASLHVMRSFKQGDKNFPFYKNGQSELYGFDVLGFDYNKTEGEKANDNISRMEWGFDSRLKEIVSIKDLFQKFIIDPFFETKTVVAILQLVPMILCFLFTSALALYSNRRIMNEYNQVREARTRTDKDYFKKIERVQRVALTLMVDSIT